jgi:hypothetical protein
VVCSSRCGLVRVWRWERFSQAEEYYVLAEASLDHFEESVYLVEEKSAGFDVLSWYWLAKESVDHSRSVDCSVVFDDHFEESDVLNWLVVV